MNAQSIDLAIRLLGRTGLGGVLLFIMPPIGEFPVAWQIQVAFLAAIAWCYWNGLFGRSRMWLATVEAAISLWMSLKWTRFLVLLFSMTF
jgi:hypothetical protein